ncbi:MAG: hypothetical protein P8K68_10625 [Algibacter sp.]|uniref:hypothetical protein n=1 Tax=Algibacter sp. TaxID=1872428 RepID=UPI00260C045E|nr:hypothetical protein [Algibacter sp.]MDG1728563.1 hypothetical protein [Algibacter sp.]MDG2179222.1 hypothetical protein [Algibacter sp.]
MQGTKESRELIMKKIISSVTNRIEENQFLSDESDSNKTGFIKAPKNYNFLPLTPYERLF